MAVPGCLSVRPPGRSRNSSAVAAEMLPRFSSAAESRRGDGLGAEGSVRGKPRPRRDRISIAIDAHVARINIIISKSKAGPRPVSVLLLFSSLRPLRLSLLLFAYVCRVRAPAILALPFPSSRLLSFSIFFPALHAFSALFSIALFLPGYLCPLRVTLRGDSLPPFALSSRLVAPRPPFSCSVLLQHA